MKQIRVMILLLGPTDELALRVSAILKSSALPLIDLGHESVMNCGSEDMVRDISERVSNVNPDILFLILNQCGLDTARCLLRSVCRDPIRVPVLLVTGDGIPSQMVELLKLGAADFMTPPLKPVDVIPRVWRLVDGAGGTGTLIHRLKERVGMKQFVGQSPAFLQAIKHLPQLARSDATVLISGETGTGKELCARAIHYLSPRAGGPFIPINCGAIPVDLIENEIFGHQRGAFTDASSTQPGLICQADGGTLFLDEIDCLPSLAQIKMLRFLQEKEYRPLGCSKIRRADVRIIAATNVDLEEAMGARRFRQDLYYRVSIVPIRLPALRDRREDIPLLVGHFLTKYRLEFEKGITDISPEAVKDLLLYDWPGNVRELEHVIQRAVVLAERERIEQADIELAGPRPGLQDESFQQAKARVIEQFEKTYIQRLLLAHHGNITRAAGAARKNRRAFWELIRKHKIDVQQIKNYGLDNLDNQVHQLG